MISLRINCSTFSANVYTNAVAGNVKDIGDAVIKEVDGRPVLIRDIARIEDGGSKDAQAVTINGEVGVYLNVLRVPGGNVVAINDEIKRITSGLKDLPPGVHVEPIFDQSTFVRSTIDGLKKEWGEAAATLGATTWQYWRMVVIPVLWPSFLGTLSLLFANAFGAIATAYALTGSSLNIVPILLYAQIRGDALQNPGLGAALALGMILITACANIIYLVISARAERWMK